jgi:outer membrane phospholipase A
MIAKKKGFSLSTHYKQGTEGFSVQTDFTYPLDQFLTSNIELYFFAQRFEGFAESLIDYKKNKHATRFGFSLVR